MSTLSHTESYRPKHSCKGTGMERLETKPLKVGSKSEIKWEECSSENSEKGT